MDFFLTHYGPTNSASARLDDTGRAALHDDLLRLAQERNRALDGTFVSDWDYLVVTGEKRRAPVKRGRPPHTHP